MRTPYIVHPYIVLPYIVLPYTVQCVHRTLALPNAHTVPHMPETYDLVVIGAGAAGIGAAATAARFGLEVAMIDKKAFHYGGDCLNYGCVPSKALLHVAHLFHGGRAARAFGLEVSGKADLGRVMAYVHERQNVIRAQENPDYFREVEGIETLVGLAEFVDARTVRVGERLLTAPKIVLATGSVPRRLEVPGVEQVTHLYTNETLFWELEALPDRLLIIGGGPIGCEMAQAFRRLGSEVTVINQGERLLEQELPEMSRILEERLRAEGIVVHHGSQVQGFRDAHTALVETAGAPVQAMAFDAVLSAIGRDITTTGLGLDRAGIDVQQGKIVVDAYYRTTNPHVWAIGDAAGYEKFSHGAELHNFDLFNNFVSPFKKKHRLDHFSWVTFTDPQVATFGLTLRQLEARNIPFERLDQPFDHDDRAIAAGYPYGHLTLLLSKPSGLGRRVHLLGGSMIAPEAGELIQELLLLTKTGLDVNTLFDKIYAYPVRSRINQAPIRTRRERLLVTPVVKRLIRASFRW